MQPENKGKIINTENMREDTKNLSTIQKKIARREHSISRHRLQSPFQYLYDFGLVGFNIAIALIIMLYLGHLLSKKYPLYYSTFMLYAIICGLSLGVYNSYRLIKREQQKLDMEDKK